MKQPLILCIAAMLIASCTNTPKPAETVYEQQSPDFNADSAYLYIAEQCAFGPRVMNSEAHDACADYIAAKFESFGAQIVNQDAEGVLYDGTKVRMRNIVASYNLDNPVRLMICSHWDSRPWADHDANADNHRTPIDGANDGASGVAVMMEIARQIQQKAPGIGVDLICFDAEDCGTPSWEENREESDRTWCLGSQYWAKHPHVYGYKAYYGILLDMVGGSEPNFQKEYFSQGYAAWVSNKVWRKAYDLGYRPFFTNELGTAISDDHIPMNEVAGIPTIDIIDLKPESSNGCFPEVWHTTNDNIDNIDKTTLGMVGNVLLHVVYEE